LFYELMRQMELIDVGFSAPEVAWTKLNRHVRQSSDEQAWHCLRAWHEVFLWQDGIGSVPDRDNDYDPVRISPHALRRTKELLIWVLCHVAHSRNEWLDLEAFLKDFWKATSHSSPSFYWHAYTWSPDIPMARSKDSFSVGSKRALAFWLDNEGTWVANAVMITLVTLGLAERGQSADAEKRPCFRLTRLGCAVLGAPELGVAGSAPSEPFLTLQPNHEILAYLDAADAGRIILLTKVAERTSTVSDRVLKFELTRQSVYNALEAGMTMDSIRAFLVANAKTPMPDNVTRTLDEWSRRRETLVLRRNVTLAAAPDAQSLDTIGQNATRLGDQFALLPKMTAKKASIQFPHWVLLDHRGALPKSGRVDETGQMTTETANSVWLARCAELADQTPTGWEITQKSIKRARTKGIATDQVLSWLQAHLTHEVPPLLEMAVRNWNGRVQSFCGKVSAMQITRPQAQKAILHSPLFEPLLAGYIPPGWFLIRDGKLAEAKRLLKRFGITPTDAHQTNTLKECRTSEQKPKPAQKRGRRTSRRR